MVFVVDQVGTDRLRRRTRRAGTVGRNQIGPRRLPPSDVKLSPEKEEVNVFFAGQMADNPFIKAGSRPRERQLLARTAPDRTDRRQSLPRQRDHPKHQQRSRRHVDQRCSG